MEPIKVDISIKNQKFLPTRLYSITCYYCGKEIILNGQLLTLRLKSKYLPNKQSCPTGSKCHKIKQGEINRIRMVEGNCAHQGCEVTNAQKEKYVKTMSERGRYEDNSKRRKGKTLIELYGEDIAKKAIEKIREARMKQDDPRLGKKHSLESRLKMSEKKLGDRGTKGIRGEYYSWYDDSIQYFDSSLEYVCFTIFNMKKLYWEKNKTILIPYEDINGYVRNYIPDIVIYKDLSKNEVKEVIEIKPQDYIDNEKSFFHNNILLKKKSADKYCESKGVSYSFFTEKDAYSYLYTNKIVDKLYITFTKITNLARSYLNDNYDLYQKYKEIKGE